MMLLKYLFLVSFIFIYISCNRGNQEETFQPSNSDEFKFEDQALTEFEGHMQLDFKFNKKNKELRLSNVEHHDGFKHLTFQQNNLEVKLFKENILLEKFTTPLIQEDDEKFAFTILANKSVSFDRIELHETKNDNFNCNIHINNIDSNLEIFNQLKSKKYENEGFLVLHLIEDRKIIEHEYFLKYERNTNSIVILFPTEELLDNFRITTLGGETIFDQNSFVRSDQYEIPLNNIYNGIHIVSFNTAFSTNIISRKLRLN